MYDDQIKDIRRVTWDGMEAMSFHQLRLGVENLQQQVRDLEEQVVSLTRDINDLTDQPGDPEVESLESEVELWFEMACDLYDVITLMEDQMAMRGIGLRPMAQQVLVRFREAMDALADVSECDDEEFDDDSDDEFEDEVEEFDDDDDDVESDEEDGD